MSEFYNLTDVQLPKMFIQQLHIPCAMLTKKIHNPLNTAIALWYDGAKVRTLRDPWIKPCSDYRSITYSPNDDLLNKLTIFNSLPNHRSIASKDCT